MEGILNMSIPGSLIKAAKVMGFPLAKKLLSHTSKGFSKYFDNAIVQGFSLDQAMGYLIDRFANPASTATESNLASREAQGQARPDEQAALQNIENSRIVPRALQSAIGYGAPIAAGARENELEQQEQSNQLQQQGQMQEQLAQQQQQQRQRQEEESAFTRERQLERDLENRKYREASEKRAIEKHKMGMERGSKPKVSETPKTSPTKVVKNSAKPPETYLEALKELDELINRLP